jgi:hypothetical protein
MFTPRYRVGSPARVRYPARKYYRTDLGIEFKSSMEANYARFLTYKGVKWEYEREILTFPHGASKIGIVLYIPDFKVIFGKTTHFIEVKGFVDVQDMEKDRLTRRFYPWLKLSYILPRHYRLIQKYYAKYIPNWE